MLALAQTDRVELPQAPMQRAEGVGRISVKQLDGRTRLAKLYQHGCAKIRLPRTNDAPLEAVLINTSGGLTGGDRMDWSIEAGRDTNLTLTSQACEKLYRSAEGHARVNTKIKVGAGARVDWLPQETILFDRAALKRTLEVHLDAGASFFGVEACILGRTGMDEQVHQAHYKDSWRVFAEGNLVHADETALGGDVLSLTQNRASLNGGCAFATLFYAGPGCEALGAKLNSVLDGSTEGASVWDNKLLVRLVAANGFALRKRLIKIIGAMRELPMPRIWHS